MRSHLVTLAVVCLATFVTADEPKPPELTPAEQMLAEEAARLSEEASQLLRNGQSADAVGKLRRALELRLGLYPAAKYPDGHPTLATSINDLGWALDKAGQGDQALPRFEAALAMRRKLFPPEKYPIGQPEVADSMFGVGVSHRSRGNYDKALEYLEPALALRRVVYGLPKYPDGHLELADTISTTAGTMRQAGRFEPAFALHEESLAMRWKLYPPDKFPDGHDGIAVGLNNLGATAQGMGRYQQALSLHGQALTMRRKLYPKEKYPIGHNNLAVSLDGEANALASMGEGAKALERLQEALGMRRKLYTSDKYPDGNRELANSVYNVAVAHRLVGNNAQAVAHYEEALAIQRKLLPPTRYPNGHLMIALTLNAAGVTHEHMESHEKARAAHTESLAMLRKLYPGGHVELARSLQNLGTVHYKLAEFPQALDLYGQALAMRRKFYPAEWFREGHYDLVLSLIGLGATQNALGSHREAFATFDEALRMQRALVEREILNSNESRALAQVRFLRGGMGHGYLTACVYLPDTAAASYALAWDLKGTVMRLLAERHLTASAQRQKATGLEKQYHQLGELQRAIGQLLNRQGRDVADRDRHLAELIEQRDSQERDLARQLPELARRKKLNPLRPDDLLNVLGADEVLIDVLRYEHSDQGKEVGMRYLAFMLAKGRPIQRIELGDAAQIDRAIHDWRLAIEMRQSSHAADRLSALVWSRLSPHIPSGTKLLYISPDGDLARLPWAALPLPPSTSGSERLRGNRILLEDFAIATVPHGRFLLEHLKFPVQPAGRESSLLVGGIDYRTREWNELPGTLAELKGIAAVAPGQVETQSQGDATSQRLLQALPSARFAHLATHGYFDALAVAPGEATGTRANPAAAKNPLGAVGLVLANGEVLSGLSIVDLPLENLKLVTLSACETGLGEYTAGEGVQGLQRAFHLAGCPNVVASLWKVNDAATAALMTKFYHEMWVNKKPPIEALREAQLTIYRRPDLIATLASPERGLKLEQALNDKGPTPSEAKGTTPTKLWAAFVLSGVGK